MFNILQEREGGGEIERGWRGEGYSFVKGINDRNFING